MITITDSRGDTTYNLDDEDYQINDTYGNDTYNLGHGNNVIDDTWGDDVYTIGDGNNTITTSWGNDIVTIGDGINTIDDSWGNDIYHLGNGTYTITGGWGSDTYYLGNGTNHITESFGADTFFAGANADYIDGGSQSYTSPTFGAHPDSDTVNYSNSKGAVNVDLLLGTARGGYAEGDTLVEIENLVGSDLSDHRDTLNGDNEANELYGMAGHDFLQGRGGADYIDGGDGWDYAIYNHSSSAININLATNVNTGGEAEGDTLVNIEAIRATHYHDTLYGDDDHNHFYGNDGNDVMYGGLGQDQFWGGNGADTMLFLDQTAFERPDLFRDFDIAEGDALDISAILSGYDALTDAIADFVQVTDNGTNSFVAVDADGGADNFITIAELYGVTGLDATTMENDGNLITV